MHIFIFLCFRAAAVETCFMKQTGRFGDVPEQEFLDCGYGHEGAVGCNGAYIQSYGKYWAVNRKTLSHESLYPYKNTDTDYTCSNLDEYKMGAQIFNNAHSYRGDEETLKLLVYTYGAVVSTVQVLSSSLSISLKLSIGHINDVHFLIYENHFEFKKRYS